MAGSPYLWSIPEGYPNKHVGLYDKVNGPDRFSFVQGEEIFGDYPAPRIHFEKSRLRELKRLGCLYNNARLPLVDNNLLTAMQAEGMRDFQVIRTIVTAKDGQTDEFGLINVTNLSRCIDHERTEGVSMATSPNFSTFRKLVLNRDGMGDRAFTRDEEYRVLILVSSKARDNLVKLKMPGLHFATPDEFFPPPKPRAR